MRFFALSSALATLLLSRQTSALPQKRDYAQAIQTAHDIAAAASAYAEYFVDSGMVSGSPKLTKRQTITRRNYDSIFTATNVVWVTAFLEDTETGLVIIPGSEVETPASVTPPPVAATPTQGSEIPSTSVPAPVISNATTPLPATTPAASRIPSPSFLRGVNLGGWLVLEKWMNSDAFAGDFSSATDEWTFSQLPGAVDALKSHWETFFTEADIQAIAATGINALRIPIGFWAYDNENTPYIKGADVYLERAITWARNAGMKVWVDCHGSPGSQNGFDNSGHAGGVQWQQSANLERSILVLKTMATKYGSLEYADVVVGLELINEPISWGANDLSITKSWAQNAYKAVKSVTMNPALKIVMHDAFQGALAWTDVARALSNASFAMDSHMYQLFVDADNTLTQAQHITKACSWASDLSAANSIMPTFVGEWSAATNICVNPDGSTTPGTSCSMVGCQCQSEDFGSWNGLMIEQVRRFVEAQLDVFESSTSGYFMWSAKGPGGWGFLNGIRNGAIPNPVTSRRYPGQCGSKRRRTQGGLGLVAEAS